MKIEIPVDKGDGILSGGASLADAFRLKKQQLQQIATREPLSLIEEPQKKEVKKEKTKEELAEIRRQMMKRPSA